MIKCTINKEIKGISFKIIYISQQYNLNSVFSVKNRGYYYVIVNLDNFSVLKENRDFYNLPEFRIEKLMDEYYSRQKLNTANNKSGFVIQDI